MMLADILVAASPDILAASGALVSEFAGIMAVFLEGIINAGAFLCFAFASFTGSVLAGCLLSVACCALLMFLTALFTEKTGANPFLTGLAVNILSGGLVSFFSLVWFGSRGTLSAPLVEPSAFMVRYGSTITAWLIAAAVVAALRKTVWGMRTRITGTNPDVLEARGLNAKKYRVLSWSLAGALAAAAGCILVLRLQAFVPNISAGRGWLALAAVFLGRKKTLGTLFAALFFTAASYAANRFQGMDLLPPGVLLAFPYLAALALFVLLPQKSGQKRRRQ